MNQILTLSALAFISGLACGTDQTYDERSEPQDSLIEEDPNRKRSSDASNVCLQSQGQTCPNNSGENSTRGKSTNQKKKKKGADTTGSDVEPGSSDTLPLPDPAAGGDPNVVVFRIAEGTGSGPWNDATSPIRVRVGQVLRIVNDDSENHRLHTNGTPCPHGPRIEPGAQFDCNVTSVYDSLSDGALYDHLAGQSAEVWIEALPAN